MLPSFDRSVRRQQSRNPRFYLFDLGVQRALRRTLNVPVTPQLYGYGSLFEQFFILEVFRLNTYLRKRFSLYYLRTKDDAEIDLIIKRPGASTVLIEIKSSTTASAHYGRHVLSFLKDFKGAEA